jgi:LysM repeat protein
MPGAPERLVLTIALLLPLGIAGLSAAHLPQPFNPVSVVDGDNESSSLVRRPASSESAPPPTLTPPTPTPVPPTPTPPPPTPEPSPTPRGQTTYVVQAGDQLKNIAATHGVSMTSIMAANDVPNPDSLRVGQTLTIPPPSP